jgi:hypothetical protein
MSEPQPRRNRRLTRRKPPRGKVRVACYRGTHDLGPNLASGLLEVSESGARLKLRSALDAGQEVMLLLEGQGHLRPLRMPGNIIWCAATTEGTFLAGVRFQRQLPWSELQHIC